MCICVYICTYTNLCMRLTMDLLTNVYENMQMYIYAYDAHA